MRVNGLSKNGVPESFAQRQSQLVFDRMSHYIGRLANAAKAADVHRFRTNSRRVEALVAELAPESGNKKKLLKQLSKLRKTVGRLRDLDVQIAFLKELKIPDHQNHRVQLLQILAEDQARRSKKLTKHFDDDKVKQLRKRLHRAQSAIMLDGIEPLKLARGHLPKPSSTPPTEKMLHASRIEAKRARYLAELVSDSPEAKSFIGELKRAQDEIGRWHDVLKLTERAERLFGGVSDSALVSALQNITHARFRRAGNALQTALGAIFEVQGKSSSQPLATKSVSESVPVTKSAAA